MHSLVYVSTATSLLSKEDLVKLLTKSMEKNRRLNVTGMLLYKEGNFLQLIEGECKVVTALFDEIKVDPRHYDAIVLLNEETGTRLFADWSMGFRNLDDTDLNVMPGYSKYMNTPLVAESFGNNPSAVLELMSMFKPEF